MQGAVCEEKGKQITASPRKKAGHFLDNVELSLVCVRLTYRSPACKLGPAVSYRICNKMMRGITPTRTKKAPLFACFTRSASKLGWLGGYTGWSVNVAQLAAFRLE